MPAPPVDFSGLWSVDWRPSANSLRAYNLTVDWAAGHLRELGELSPTEIARARQNLARLATWIKDEMIVGRNWARKKAWRLSGELGFLSISAIATLGGPITWLGAIGLVGAAGFFLHDVADVGFKQSAQERVRQVLVKIDLIERATR